jgi:Fe2+ or Zn2+ uptake regulation protein
MITYYPHVLAVLAGSKKPLVCKEVFAQLDKFPYDIESLRRALKSLAQRGLVTETYDYKWSIKKARKE